MTCNLCGAPLATEAEFGQGWCGECGETLDEFNDRMAAEWFGLYVWTELEPGVMYGTHKGPPAPPR